MSWQSDYVTFHRRIHEQRKSLGISQPKAAEIIGVSERTYRTFETGGGDLEAAKVFKLANHLGIKIIISDGVIADGVD
ncbi:MULTISPECIES: helix-turn-helix transcriptional regulator [Thalassospira]|jgi:transcriptional regulator with XRE-family HTH domain|uniref:Transcriptional regulator n=1 Tax=Thalassospira lohafexi TaxID=744227 RepID=A0A2N3L1B1_9PROT|nr:MULTISPECIES: helix-turn-helix transcriptional regulator [Thalassospira]PKR56591.1 transcriptional regulator [Thalassospira lohafexi]|tara:strand:- start:30622 stop:30855 length:234 start_codon:yes stop_codon:yes gene_type:complete